MLALKTILIVVSTIATVAVGRAYGDSSLSSHSVRLTWGNAHVMISGSLVGSDEPFVSGQMDGKEIAIYLRVLDSMREVPIVVAISGSAGNMTDLALFAEPMMDLGLVFIILNSPARGKNWIDCWRSRCGEARARRSLEMRIEEAEFAHESLVALSWASKSKSVLMGFSWGGMATAIYPRDDYDARMIIAWTCHTRNWIWLNGIRGSLRTPVFSAVAARDQIYDGKPWAWGHCSTDSRPLSKTLILDSSNHYIMEMLEVRQEAHRFLSEVFGNGSGQGDDRDERHLLAPLVIDESSSRITLKRVGTIQGVYDKAKEHCEGYGKKSFPICTEVDGGSYIFLCE